MLSDYEIQQQALKQKLARQQAQDQINALEAKLQQIIQIQKEIEEQDFQYQIKCDDLQKKRDDQMKEIEKLRASQQNDLERTKAMYEEMWKMAEKFQERQQKFIHQQKLDKDQLKSFQVTQTAKQSVYEINKELVVSQNPFVLLSQAQGFLDSQYDTYYQLNYPKIQEILEKEQQYQKSEIQITFVSFKPDTPALEIYEKRKFEGTLNQIPLSMHFLIDFYDFPTYKTDNLIYEECPTIEDIRKVIGYDQELKLAYENYFTNKAYGKKACFSFEVENDLKFVYYLLFKNAFIRVVDSITGENYGYCQLPLHSLIRGDKSNVFSIQEIQLLSYDWKVTFGIFTITIQNIGIQLPSNYQTQDNFGKTVFSQIQNIQSKLDVNLTTLFNQTMDNRSKIQTSYLNMSKGIDENDRIKLRISQLKPQSSISQARKKISSSVQKDIKQYTRSNIVNFKISNVPDNLRLTERIKAKHLDLLSNLSTRDDFNKLSAIQLSRNWDKQQILRQVLPSHLQKQDLYLPIGEKCIQFIEFKNESDDDKILKVEIDSSIYCYLAQEDELDYIYESQGIAFDQRVEALNGQFQCHAQQNCLIAIVFYQKNEFFNEVQTVIYIKLKQQPISGILYQVIPKSQVIDMTFEFYKQPNNQEEIFLPPVFCFCEIKHRNTPVIICNKEEITFAINPDDMRIKLEVKTKDIGKQIILLLFMYRDKFCHILLSTVLVKITSLNILKISSTTGQATQSQIEFKCDKRRNIYFHSLNQDKAWFETPYDKPVWIDGQVNTIIPIKVFQMSQNQHTIKINAVDQTTNELVYSWLLQISSDMPLIKRVFTFNSFFRQAHPFKIRYVNDTEKTLLINIVSSSYLLKCFQQTIKISPKGQQEFELALMKAEEYPQQDFNLIEKQREILLFLYDIKNKIFDCYLFQFHFYDQEVESSITQSNPTSRRLFLS